MPWRMIVFLIVLGLVVFFASFNITNVSDISFGVTELKDIPIFVSLFISFLIGAVVMLPFVFAKGKKNAKKKREEATPEQSVQATAIVPETKRAKKEKKIKPAGRKLRRKKSRSADIPTEEEVVQAEQAPQTDN
jgi:uncharacterized integral membrane protein